MGSFRVRLDLHYQLHGRIIVAIFLCYSLSFFFFPIICVCYTLLVLLNSASPSYYPREGGSDGGRSLGRHCHAAGLHAGDLPSHGAAPPPTGFWERLSKSLIIERFQRLRASALWLSFEFNLGAFAAPLHRSSPLCRAALFFYTRQAIPF